MIKTNPNNFNSNAIEKNNKRFTGFFGGWVNYLKADGSWSAIDCILVKDETGFHIVNAPFEFHAPLLSDGEALFNNNNRYDPFAKKNITADPFSQTMKAFAVGSVEGIPYDINGDGRLDAVKYPNAYSMGIHLVYYVRHGEEPELEQLVQFDQKPLIDTDYEFENAYSGKVEISPRRLPANTTRRQHRNNSEVKLNTPERLSHDEGFYIRKWEESQKRGMGIKTPLIWDSAGKQEVIDADIRKGAGANKYIITKHIKTDFFDDVVYPVFTDTTSTFFPDIIPTTSVDGSVARTLVNEAWTTIRNGAGTMSQDTAPIAEFIRIQWSGVAGQFASLRRSPFLFDTSIIGSDNIDGASFIVTGSGNLDIGGIKPDINLFASNPASNTALQPSDYGTFGDIAFSTAIPYDGFNIAGENVFVLNPDGLNAIDGSGVTKLGLRNENYDVDNISPGSDPIASLLSGRFADAVTDKPTFIVEHSPPPPPPPVPNPIPIITTHNQDAKNRLLEQYKKEPRIEGLIQSYFGTQVQDLENAFQELFGRLNIEDSVGVQLNGIGRIVDQDRLGLTDELYRLFLRARIGANVSEGDIERLIEVWKTITQASIVKLEEVFPAEVNLATDVALPDNLIDAAFALIQEVSGAGIGVGITTFLPVDAFAFEGADPATTKGFGDAITQGTTDGTTVLKLVDSGASFIVAGVVPGMVAMNDTDGTKANITVVDATELTLDTDIFITGEDYYINANTGGQLAKIQGAN